LKIEVSAKPEANSQFSILTFQCPRPDRDMITQVRGTEKEGLRIEKMTIWAERKEIEN